MRRELPTGLSPENLSRHHRHSLCPFCAIRLNNAPPRETK